MPHKNRMQNSRMKQLRWTKGSTDVTVSDAGNMMSANVHQHLRTILNAKQPTKTAINCKPKTRWYIKSFNHKKSRNNNIVTGCVASNFSMNSQILIVNTWHVTLICSL